MNLQGHLTSLHACLEAKKWAGDRTAQQTWDQCTKPEWLLWWAAKTAANNRQQLVRCACDCARLVLHLVPAGEDRPRLAIEAAEKWADNPTVENLEAVTVARHAAYAAAAAAADAADAAYAAEAAAYAAAYAAADAAADAAYAAADAAADAAARNKIRAECCGAIRKRLIIPWTE